jgi:hypothetical protein
MNILALWSGGLDSTYMLKMLSEQGHSVRAGYVEFLNNDTKIAREKAAIEGLIQQGFRKQYDIDYRGTIYSVKMKRPSLNFRLSQPMVWLNALASMANEDTDAIAIGYVMNDDAVSFLEDFKRIYRSFWPLLNHTPKLIFPLAKTSKVEAWVGLGDPYRQYVSWCENTGEEDLCGTCVPCRKMKYLGLWPYDEATLLKCLEE